MKEDHQTQFKTDDTIEGLILFCDQEGIIEEVLYNQVSPEITGRLQLLQFIDRRNIDKYLNFLLQIKNEGYAIGWEVMLCVGDECRIYQFGGVTDQERILILAYSTYSDLYEQLMRINNEQANLLRSKAKEHIASDSHSEHLYGEMTRINNELINARRELAKQNAQLTNLIEEKNRIMGMLAHDLRNPIGAIDGFVNVLMGEDEIGENDAIQQILSYIQQSNRFMLELLTEVLDLSRIEAGKIDLEKRKTDLNTLIEENLAINRVVAEKKGLQLTFDANTTVPPVPVDPVRINQVLNNLISNAVKFSYPDGKIAVELTHAADEGLVSLRVVDQGQGIVAEEIESLFLPFTKTTTVATEGESSTGLGLAIVKKIVDLHEGRVTVQSEVGEGTTFEILLPVDFPARGDERKS